MATYAKLTEYCDNEAETWRFYIPLESNEDQLGELETALTEGGFEEEEPVDFDLDLTAIPEHEVDILVKHGGDTTYMEAHNKLSGVLVIPKDVLAKLAAGDSDHLYKGGIRDYMHQTDTTDGVVC